MVLNVFHLLLLATLANGINDSVRITKFQQCDPLTDYPLKIKATFKTVRNAQYLDYNGTYTIPYVYNASMHVHIAISPNGKNFIHMMTLRGDDVCAFQRKYLGEFYFLILERSGLTRDTCPIPAGIYSSRNMKIDFSNIPVDALPAGVVRLRQMVIQKKTKKLLSCVDMEISNKLK
ncbi:uncharacterized protein [Atheta coriaria]|uniref:uncharacterized protein n=1 Tax=Dalotia coriaria TaxID=877792 RepID=UPI0031F37477